MTVAVTTEARRSATIGLPCHGALRGSFELRPRTGAFQWSDSGPGRVLSGPGFAAHIDPHRVTVRFQGPRVGLAFGAPRPGVLERLDAFIDRGLDAMPDAESGCCDVALALFDLESGTAAFVSDRFATRPICFAVAGGSVHFSDRADAVPGCEDRELDLQALFDYVYFHVIPAPRTVFRGVERLEPATRVSVSSEGIERRRTWRPAFVPKRKAPLAELRTELMRLLEAAVQARVGDGPVGTYLSGGIDSSTVTGMLKRRIGRSAPAFSIGFEETGYDEMQYARLAARFYGVEHHEYYVTPADIADFLPSVAAGFDQPFGNSSALPAFCCARFARSLGVETLLAGDGGDELFGGNTRYAKQNIFEVYGRIPTPLRSVFEPLTLSWPLGSTPGLKKISSYVRQARLSMPARMETYNLLDRFGARTLLHPALLDAVDTSAPSMLQKAVYEACEAPDLVDRMLAYDWRFTLTDNDLPKVAGSAALADTAVAFPFLDDALVDFSLTLPSSEKVNGTELRHFFKRAMADFLPTEVIRKKKHGFGLPFGAWTVRNQNLNALASDALHSLSERRVINTVVARELLSERLEAHPGYYGELVWILITLELWLAAHRPRFAL